MLMYCLKALTKLSFVMIETMIEEVIVAAGHYYDYNVSLQLLEGTPEQDFYYMSHARQLVVGVGGFSRIIGKMVKYHGGTIIGRTF